jgi:hypothetical protein
VTSQGGSFEHTRGPVTSALAQSSAVLRELGQVWRDAEAQLVELRQPAALDVGQLKSSGRGEARNDG